MPESTNGNERSNHYGVRGIDYVHTIQPTNGLIDYLRGLGNQNDRTYQWIDHLAEPTQTATEAYITDIQYSRGTPDRNGFTVWPEACAAISPKPETEAGMKAFYDAHPELRGIM